MRLLNPALPRRVTLFVAVVIWISGCNGQTDTIPPEACTLALSPSSTSHDTSSNTASFTVTAPVNCSWSASSDVDWVTVIGGSSGGGNGSVTYHVAENPTTSARTASIKVVGADSLGATVLHQVSQTASTWLPIRGTYTFVMVVDPDGTCGWPVTTFYWPVTIEVTSYVEGTTLGSIVFPTTQASPSNTWSISASPTRTELVPRQESPGPAGGEYDVVVDGGHWEAGGLIRGHDGKGEITNGTASDAKQILTLRDSDKHWECQADVKWSLLIRYVDKD